MKTIIMKRNIKNKKCWPQSFDTFVIFATTSSSITLSLTGVGLIVIPISTSLACGLTISNKVIFEIVRQKCNKYKNNMKKISKQLNLSTNSITVVYKIFLLITMIMSLYVIFLLMIRTERKIIPFWKDEHKNKKNLFFSNNNLKFNLGPSV